MELNTFAKAIDQVSLHSPLQFTLASLELYFPCRIYSVDANANKLKCLWIWFRWQKYMTEQQSDKKD